MNRSTHQYLGNSFAKNSSRTDLEYNWKQNPACTLPARPCLCLTLAWDVHCFRKNRENEHEFCINCKKYMKGHTTLFRRFFLQEHAHNISWLWSRYTDHPYLYQSKKAVRRAPEHAWRLSCEMNHTVFLRSCQSPPHTLHLQWLELSLQYRWPEQPEKFNSALSKYSLTETEFAIDNISHMNITMEQE